MEAERCLVKGVRDSVSRFHDQVRNSGIGLPHPARCDIRRRPPPDNTGCGTRHEVSRFDYSVIKVARRNRLRLHSVLGKKPLSPLRLCQFLHWIILWYTCTTQGVGFKSSTSVPGAREPAGTWLKIISVVPLKYRVLGGRGQVSWNPTKQAEKVQMRYFLAKLIK